MSGQVNVYQVIPDKDIVRYYSTIINLGRLKIDPRASESTRNTVRRSILRIRFDLMSLILTKDGIEQLLTEKIMNLLTNFEDSLILIESENDDLNKENNALKKTNRVIGENLFDANIKLSKLELENSDLKKQLAAKFI